MDIEEVAETISICVDDWVGCCHEIAFFLLDKKIVDGALRYGHWTGPVNRSSIFYGEPIVRHGWIERPDGSICDPTRWTIEAVEPYIYEGPNDYYDVGGQIFRKQFLQPPPLYDEELDPRYPAWTKPCELRMQPQDEEWMRAILKLPDNVPHPTLNQVGWIANLPLDMFPEERVRHIYMAIDGANHAALIPIDHWDYVFKGER